MMFESPTGIERNKKVQLAQAGILLAVIAWFFLYTSWNAPAKNSVDGVYRNECCSDIIIRDGRLFQGRSELNMKLLNMKFGLTGYVNAEFMNGGIRASKEETAISFDNEKGVRTLTLPIDRQERTFRLVGEVRKTSPHP
jgi:hypothetical protein